MIFWNAEQVAQELGLPAGKAFLRRRAALEQVSDFPPPMPTSQRPMLWRADAVKCWKASQGLANRSAKPADPTERRLLKLAKSA